MSEITIGHVDQIAPKIRHGIELRTLTPPATWPQVVEARLLLKVEQGTIMFDANGDEQLGVPGSVFYIPPGSVHGYYAKGSGVVVMTATFWRAEV